MNRTRPGGGLTNFSEVWEVRPITENEADLFRARLSRGFGGDADADDGAAERFRELFDLERSVAAFDEGDIVGTGGAFPFEITVPGGTTTPMGGTTIITVQPTHRRRGVLTEMMNRHLDDVHSRGEPIAVLWSSESSIYGRFGYGLATQRHKVTMSAPDIELTSPQHRGRVRLLDADDAMPILVDVYERARTEVSGMLSRSEAWWRLRRMRDDDSIRGGRSARRYAVYEEDGSPAGYATFRQKEKWEEFPEGEIQVIEVIANTAGAHRGLWSFLVNIDLYPSVDWWNAPVDDPLPFHVADSRRVRRELFDALWVRLIDIPKALESRSYEFDGSVVMGVDDGFRPENTGSYRLTVEGGVAGCARVGDEPDLSCDVDVLGHLYLGGGDALAMAHANRITGDPEAIRVMQTMFKTDRAPWCPEVF